MRIFLPPKEVYFEKLSRLEFAPSCQPHHHVNHVIMSTTHLHAVGRCISSEACEFTRENIQKTADKKCTGLGCHVRGIFGRCNRQKLAPKCIKSSISYENRKRLACSALVTVREWWSIWCVAPAMRVCSWTSLNTW